MHLLAQTTNSGSNNYTMATEMHNRLSKIAQEAGEEYSWNPVDMVVKCFCHKMSLVVNAGLEALGVTPAPAQVVRKSVLGSFPVNDLLSAVEESLEEQEEGPSTVHQSAQIPISDDLINLEDPLDCDEQNDPLNEPAHTVGDNWYNDNNFSQSAPFVTPYAPTHEPVFIVPPATEDQQAASHLDGLLKRLDYVIRKLTSSSSMRALLAATAAAMGLSFDALIAGYGIRWNIKWDSRYCAWKARDIIDKILKNNQRDNEDCPASSNTGTHNPATNYGKGCFLKISFTPDDWKLIKVVNLELEHFALLTKRMEGDGPTGSMVIQEYLKLKKRLESRLLNASTTSPLYPMHYAMLTRVKKYLTEATSSHALLMATMLHPSWRGSFFTTGFGPRSPVTQKANRLLEDAYHIRKNQLEMSRSSPAPASGPEANVSSTECNDDSYDPMLHLHDAQKGTSTIDELAEYQLGRDAPSNDVAMDPKLALKWWQSHENKYPVLSTLARQYLAVSGSSAAVERTFSSAADVCTTDRGKLAPRTIERCVSSRLWIANGVQLDSEFEEAYQVMQKCIEFDEAARSQCANQAHFPGD